MGEENLLLKIILSHSIVWPFWMASSVAYKVSSPVYVYGRGSLWSASNRIYVGVSISSAAMSKSYGVWCALILLWLMYVGVLWMRWLPGRLQMIITRYNIQEWLDIPWWLLSQYISDTESITSELQVRYTHTSTKLKGGYVGFTLSVRLSVCGQNRVPSVSSIIPIDSISYLQILSSNFRRCVARKVGFQIHKLVILAFFFKFVTLALFSFDLGSNMTK